MGCHINTEHDLKVGHAQQTSLPGGGLVLVAPNRIIPRLVVCFTYVCMRSLLNQKKPFQTEQHATRNAIGTQEN